MTGQDWINSVWPYAYIIGGIVAFSIVWMWNRRDEDRAESKERHPANREVPTGLAAYDPANGEWWEGR